MPVKHRYVRSGCKVSADPREPVMLGEKGDKSCRERPGALARLLPEPLCHGALVTVARGGERGTATATARRGEGSAESLASPRGSRGPESRAENCSHRSGTWQELARVSPPKARGQN